MLFRVTLYLVSVFLSYQGVQAKVYASAYLSESTGELYIEESSPQPGSTFFAEGVYEEQTEGWDLITIKAGNSGTNKFKAFAMGYVEGSFSYKKARLMYNNMIANFAGPVRLIIMKTWAGLQLRWVENMISEYSDADEYWHTIDLVMSQLRGFASYSMRHAPESEQMTFEDMYLLNSANDLQDVFSVISRLSPNKMSRNLRKAFSGFGSQPQIGTEKLDCSALVRLKPDNRSAFIFHSTWTFYCGMMRAYKTYVYPQGQAIEFSSYPGFMFSGDDWYIQQNGGRLIVTETTNANYGIVTGLWLMLMPAAKRSVLTWQRGIVATILATDGKSWTETAMKFNSGSCNNQWMVIDRKKLESGSKTDVLWIAEQAVWSYETKDVSDYLFENGYWKSFNVPYLSAIYNALQYPLKDGQSLWYAQPRSKIFDRDAPKVHDFADAQKLSRANDYLHDPLSDKCARSAVASRYDLSTLEYCGVGSEAFGAIDAKVIDTSAPKDVQIISGPTTGSAGDLPVFDWSTANFSKKWVHDGVPTRFDFSWIKPVGL